MSLLALSENPHRGLTRTAHNPRYAAANPTDLDPADHPSARARGALSSFFVWAMQMGLVENNPTIGSTKPAESKPRERVLSSDELARIWRACGDDAFGKIIKLLVLTGCRRAEVGDMAWSEADFDRGHFTVPSARSKNGRAHTLPLIPMMRGIITSVLRMASRDQLFGMRGDGFTGWVKGKRALDARSGGHDFTSLAWWVVVVLLLIAVLLVLILWKD